MHAIMTTRFWRLHRPSWLLVSADGWVRTQTGETLSRGRQALLLRRGARVQQDGRRGHLTAGRLVWETWAGPVPRGRNVRRIDPEGSFALDNLTTKRKAFHQ